MQPTPIVGLHAAAAALVGIFGLTFVADPCGGGGDLCLGGYVALISFIGAGIGLVGIVVWRVARRASPLLVWDVVLAAIAGFALVAGGGSGPAPITLLALGGLALWIPGGILAARALAGHSLEAVIAVAALVLVGAIGGAFGTIVLAVLGLIALGIGRAMGPFGPPAAPAPDTA